MKKEVASLSRPKIEAACIVIKKAVNARRQQEGFRKPVTAQQWNSITVKKQLEKAAYYLVQNCCEAEREDLIANPYPDDYGLDQALQMIGQALNGLMAFADKIPELSERHLLPVSPETKGDFPAVTISQALNLQASSDYLHWLLESDEWLQEYRANIPYALTEQQMVDLLLSPLSQVLSFDDFKQINLCPITTRGRVTLVKQWEIEKPFQTKAQRQIALSHHDPPQLTVSEFAVEADAPDGTTIHLTVQHTGRPNIFSYDIPWMGLDDADRLESAGGYKNVEGLTNFRRGSLGDLDCYPSFPSFQFQGYWNSICWHTYGLNITMRENEFYTDESDGYRFLLMRINAPLFDFNVVRGDDIYVPEWGSTMSTKSTLHIPNWALPEDVADYWRQVRPKNARERRLPSAEHVELFRFVLENTEPGTEPKWASLVRGWQELKAEAMTRDKLYKIYHSVLQAFFPNHPSKKSLQFSQQRLKEMKEDTRAFHGETP